MVHEDKNDFSDGAKKDVLEMFELFKHMLNTSIGIYRDEDYAQYSALMEDENYMDLLEYKARQKHFDRMARNECATGCRRQRLLRYSGKPGTYGRPLLQHRPLFDRSLLQQGSTGARASLIPSIKQTKEAALTGSFRKISFFFSIPFQFLFITARPAQILRFPQCTGYECRPERAASHPAAAQNPKPAAIQPYR